MANDCCKLAGGLIITLDGCIISINMTSRTEVVKECDGEALIGPTTGTVSLSAFMDNVGIYQGCPAKAGVSIPWVRKYDCETDTLYFINSGKGTSFIAGPVSEASILISTGRIYPTMNASAGGGPTSLVMQTDQEDGYGLSYSEGPINFTSDSISSITFPMSSILGGSIEIPSGATDLYLQNFNLEKNPGNVPTVNYSFAFGITDR